MSAIDLRESTRRLFAECANDYITGDRNWGCDIDIIVRCANQWPDVSVVELGSGHGWHLANLLYLASSQIRGAVGIDYSSAMIERATCLLASVECAGESLLRRVELIECNLLDTRRDSSSCQLVLMLNNTLGNLAAASFAEAERERRTALVEARRLLADTGRLVLTVYHALQMDKECAYGGVFTLDRDMSEFANHDLVVRYSPTSTPCYSHWFEEKEVRALLDDCGFEVVMSEVRLRRLVFVCRKRGRL